MALYLVHLRNMSYKNGICWLEPRLGGVLAFMSRRDEDVRVRTATQLALGVLAFMSRRDEDVRVRTATQLALVTVAITHSPLCVCVRVRWMLFEGTKCSERLKGKGKPKDNPLKYVWGSPHCGIYSRSCRMHVDQRFSLPKLLLHSPFAHTVSGRLFVPKSGRCMVFMVRHLSIITSLPGGKRAYP